MKVSYDGKILSKQIGANSCDEHKVGDFISMKYLDGEDQILFPDESIIGNAVSLILLLLFGAFIVFYALKTL
jgi:hypothetical protein